MLKNNQHQLMQRSTLTCFFICCLLLFSCNKSSDTLEEEALPAVSDTVFVPVEEPPLTAADIRIEKQFTYDKYTLDDHYPYKDTTRSFQWEKIREKLALLENAQRKKAVWGILRNYKNLNREAPLVRSFVRNEYKMVSDTLGVERYQSAPLYLMDDTETPERYGRDGWLVKLQSSDTTEWVQVEGVSFEGAWQVPKRYVKAIGDTVAFLKVVVVDVTNQNIMSLEKSDSTWLVRSMNPATTGRHRPPYAHETPVGMFLIQEKKARMNYMKDGSHTEKGGFAPFASRFTNGAYIHGVPTVHPGEHIIEYSPSLGTTPRSHMCVRNASSHAKFIYEWSRTNQTVVFVID